MKFFNSKNCFCKAATQNSFKFSLCVHPLTYINEVLHFAVDPETKDKAISRNHAMCMHAGLKLDFLWPENLIYTCVHSHKTVMVITYMEMRVTLHLNGIIANVTFINHHGLSKVTQGHNCNQLMISYILIHLLNLTDQTTILNPYLYFGTVQSYSTLIKSV